MRNEIRNVSDPFDDIEFDDGTTLSYEALLAQGFDLTGTAGNDTIAGTDVNDRIVGGTGNDTLTGGAGNDRYNFALGDGQDQVIDTAGNDTVVFGAGLNATDISVAQRIDSSGRWLDLAFAGGADAQLSFLKSRRWRYGELRLRAANGETWRKAA